MPSRPNREHGRNALQALPWVQLAREGRDADQSPVRDLDAAPAARGGKAMARPSSSIPDRAAGDGAKVNAVASRIVPAAVQAGGEVVGPRPKNFDVGPPYVSRAITLPDMDSGIFSSLNGARTLCDKARRVARLWPHHHGAGQMTPAKNPDRNMTFGFGGARQGSSDARLNESDRKTRL